jgi:hypothetical protein
VKEVRHSRREWLLDPTATATARPTKNVYMFRGYVEAIGDVHDAHATPFVAATEETDLGEKRYPRHPRSGILEHLKTCPRHHVSFIYILLANAEKKLPECASIDIELAESEGKIAPIQPVSQTIGHPSFFSQTKLAIVETLDYGSFFAKLSIEMQLLRATPKRKTKAEGGKEQ